MGSSIQVEQIIGRVLRQHGAAHYDSPLLNSAHFFLRVDRQSVFTDAIAHVTAKLQSEGAPIEIAAHFGAGAGGAADLLPKEDADVELHHVFVDSEAARQRIEEIADDFPTFTEGDQNTVGIAQTASKVVELTELGNTGGAPEWTTDGQTNPVRLRWLVNTAIRSRSLRALAVLDLKSAKFDVRVQIQSKADKLAEKLAQEVVAAFYQHSDLVYESAKPFTFGTLRVPKSGHPFAHGLYERYAGFNKFELAFANGLDKLGKPWHRNPSNGGFHIPLLSEGDTASFYPDFITWKKGTVYCLDTKGGHLLSDAVARKLFDIKEDGKTKVLVRFITEGKQAELRGKVIKGGYTVWKMKSGTPTPIDVADIDRAVAECLR